MKDFSTISPLLTSSFPAALGFKSSRSRNDQKDLISIPNIPVNQLIAQEVSQPETEDSFFVADVGEVYRQLVQWESLFPDVKPFFAIKSNPDPIFLRLLANLGTGFDCASKNEIQCVLNYGVNPSRIIFANPCKPSSHIRFAAAHGVLKMTFDNVDELHKIKKFCPQAQVVLRILTDDSKSVCQFGIKFGASLIAAQELVATAHQLGLDLIGVSFHVGSGCFDGESYCDAIHRARVVFDAAAELGYKLHLLDIGGGFPGANTKDGSISLESIADAVHRAMVLYFPEGGIELISEPGRYFVASALTLSCNVTSLRSEPRDNVKISASNIADTIDCDIVSKDDHPTFKYYINDGVYGSFNCIMFDHAVIVPKVLKYRDTLVHEAGVSVSEPLYESSVWGPTCDSLDVITKSCFLPALAVGDWLYFSDLGAYTICAASEFNGFNKSRVIYTNTEASAVNARLNL
ncbi:Ornithine decarboxylase [Entomophthora muscae]|uniref:Ornithine decarboxylase n=1 Tax=Entomophthora muscae TaxID=34485 RepID=A0ACC2URM2_9FUNG|nr:Ornithine decarboxylase [Entomophthora muscae]